tara:strand:+ start:523 stop:978 length:456 start_codon:yes stop_codon:yes gene_type:complete
MIKKILLTILFLNFSFGQDSLLVGSWNGLSHNVSYIFDEDGTGFYSSVNGKESEQIQISWETRNTITLTEMSTGVLIMTTIIEGGKNKVLICNYVVSFTKRQKSDFKKTFPNYNGNHTLLLWDVGRKLKDDDLIIEQYLQKSNSILNLILD